MAKTGNCCFVFLILRNPSMEIGKIVGIHVTPVVLTGGKTAILGKIFDKIPKWRLTIHNWDKYR